jgi:hypothetical protein
MAESSTKVREVAWSELFPWTMLIRSVRIALMARVILLGTLGLLATMLGWVLLGALFSKSSDPLVRSWDGLIIPWIGGDFWVDISTRSAFDVFGSAISNLVQAPVAIWLYLTRPFIEIFDGERTAGGVFFLLICCIWELLVWGLVGGAITRIAALKFTRDEAPGFIASLTHAARKLPSYSLPPLVAMGASAFLAIGLVLLGLVMRLDVLAFVAGIFWPFVLVVGLMMAILLLGALIGWPLMWATVSVEGTDGFDALSRSYAYTYHRPFRLLWYVLFAGILAVISMFVVKLFAASAIALGNWSVDWGLDEYTMQQAVSPPDKSSSAPVDLPPPEITGTQPAADVDAADEAAETAADVAEEAFPAEPNAMIRGARSMIDFWKMMVAALAAGYQAGFLWVSAVGVYLLMRRDIDGVQLNDVYIDPADEFGLPPLADEATGGVPDVAPGAPAQPGDTGPT